MTTEDVNPIISYQVMTGNYSSNASASLSLMIISYQVMTGNYSPESIDVLMMRSYHTK